MNVLIVLLSLTCFFHPEILVTLGAGVLKIVPRYLMFASHRMSSQVVSEFMPAEVPAFLNNTSVESLAVIPVRVHPWGCFGPPCGALLFGVT
eukprot:8792289-Karenia_brevis.AAC.1